MVVNCIAIELDLKLHQAQFSARNNMAAEFWYELVGRFSAKSNGVEIDMWGFEMQSFFC